MAIEVMVIAGPTASGKSALSIEIAKELNCQIVSADSMQIYRGMDIGTAKVPEADRQVKHYGIDIADPGEPYSAALFQEYARESFRKIDQQGSKPILCGGTGFYIRAAIDDYEFPKGDQVDNPIRSRYQEILEEKGSMCVWEILREKDPDSASLIHPNNSKRVIRALELFEDGKNYALQSNALKDLKQKIPAIMFLIDVNRELLNDRIERRVEDMRESGLIEEVEGLLDRGFREAITASQAIGYKEVVDAIDGRISMDEAFERIKISTRRYAKRQRSWFRGDFRYHSIDGNAGDVISMMDQVLSVIDRSKGW